mgnify:CR=1 FL=1
MTTVACCCVPGPGNYAYEHVKRLQLQVAEHLKQPYQFFCLDDSPLPGWWAKISLFRPGRFTGRILYLDLDVTIVGSLDEVMNYQRFAGARDPLNRGINSSVMVWDAGSQDRIYTEFTPDVMSRFHGDQDWINHIALPAKFPVEWFPSFKYDLSYDMNNIHDGTKAVLYHGRIKPWC